MAINVNTAIAEFMRDSVNLDPSDTSKARASRDWLLSQIAAFPSTDSTFPTPFQAMDLPLGSFHRRTKLRPLDDIDQIIGLSAEGSAYETHADRIELHVNAGSNRLLRLCHEGTSILNSKRVLNKFVAALTAVPQYKRADIGRNGEAAVVSLATYDWSFDVVPAFFTKPEEDGRTYYLIPDGSGNWKKTDPRIDEARVTRINQRHDGRVLPCIRLMKYWNRRRTVPTISSYALESMILSHYESRTDIASVYLDIEVRSVLIALSNDIYYPVQDPKRIQGDPTFPRFQ